MPVYINGKYPKKIKLNGKVVKKIYLNGHKVYSNEISPHHLFSTALSTYGTTIKLYNGVEVKTFSKYGHLIDDFISSGNGTRKVLKWINLRRGTSLEFTEYNAPDLVKESDGSYAVELQRIDKSLNKIFLKGNMMVMVYKANAHACIVWNHSSGIYMYTSQSSSNNKTSQGVGNVQLYIGNDSTQDSRSNLSSYVTQGYQVVVYRNVDFKDKDWQLNGYPYSFYVFSGRIKEISTHQVESDEDAEAIINNVKARHNL